MRWVVVLAWITATATITITAIIVHSCPNSVVSVRERDVDWKRKTRRSAVLQVAAVARADTRGGRACSNPWALQFSRFELFMVDAYTAAAKDLSRSKRSSRGGGRTNWVGKEKNE